jgi:restriction endonuclease S subunit
MTTKMSAVVLSSIKTDFGMKPLVSTDTTTFFPIDNKDEALYLCAILNSEIVNNFIKSFSSAGRGFGTPSIMNNFAIPGFNNSNETHKQLAELSEKAHNLVKRGKSIESIEQKISVVVKKLWNIK